MKKQHLLAAGLLTLGLLVSGTVAVRAVNGGADGDTLNYTCWNGKTVSLTAQAFKQKQQTQAAPGSAEHKLAMQKMKELQAIPGVVTDDGRGHQTITIDDNNPNVQKVMKTYETQEYPECR